MFISVVDTKTEQEGIVINTSHMKKIYTESIYKSTEAPEREGYSFYFCDICIELDEGVYYAFSGFFIKDDLHITENQMKFEVGLAIENVLNSNNNSSFSFTERVSKVTEELINNGNY